MIPCKGFYEVIALTYKHIVYPQIIFFILIGFLITSGMLTPLIAAEKQYNIVIIGDSLSSGFGVKPEEAYPSIMQDHLKKIGKQWNNSLI